MTEGSVAILDPGAAANLVSFRQLNYRNSISGKMGLPRVSSYPDQAQFKFGGGRVEDMHYAAEIKVGITGAE